MKPLNLHQTITFYDRLKGDLDYIMMKEVLYQYDHNNEYEKQRLVMRITSCTTRIEERKSLKNFTTLIRQDTMELKKALHGITHHYF